MKIGVAGIGRMRIAIGPRPSEQGNERVVWDRTAERAKPLIDAVYRGKDGLLGGNVAGETAQVRLQSE